MYLSNHSTPYGIQQRFSFTDQAEVNALARLASPMEALS